MRPMKRAIEQCLEQHRRRPVRFLRDPAGIVVACFTWSIIIVSTSGIWMSLIAWLGPYSLWGSLEGAILTASVGMCAWSHYMTMTTEPGIVPLKKNRDEAKVYGKSQSESGNEDEVSESDLEEEDIEMPLDEFENREDDGSLLIFCDDCNMYRPTRAMHCDTCERCVVLMDHHCPWVNNCVGVGNQKYFLLFLFYVAVTSVHVLLLVVFQRVICSSGQAFCGFDAGKFPGQLGMYLVAASCTFGLFCVVMLVMEIHSIDDDPIYSSIAKQLHVRTGCKSKSRAERHLSVIFGTNGFDWTWLLPLPMRRNRQDWQIIGGFGGGGGDNSAEEV